MPRVTKQKNGRYQRSVKIGVDADGKPIRKFFTATTLREVDAMVAAFKQEQKQADEGTEQAALVNTTTFSEMGAIWLSEYKRHISDGARRRYESVLEKHLKPVIGGVMLADLKPLHLRSIINKMADDGYSGKTLAEIKQTAAQVMEAAVENDMARRNVFAKIRVPKTEAEEREPVSEATRRLILDTCAEHRMGIPALSMLYMGIRKGELIALKWEDIDLAGERLSVNKAVTFHNNSVSVKTPKTKSGFRSVPIPKLILQILTKAKAAAASEYVCPSVEGKLMTHTAYNSAWNSYLHFLNLKAGGRDASRSNPKVQAAEEFTAHQLRHTYATMLYDAGVDVKSAQKFLGHSDIQVTLKIYTHLSEGKEQAAVDALNAFFDKQTGIPSSSTPQLH
ncbi:MAG: site-specific integrase [Clostridia bacterium]